MKHLGKIWTAWLACVAPYRGRELAALNCVECGADFRGRRGVPICPNCDRLDDEAYRL